MLTFNLKKYNLNLNGSMLDVGCGEGRHIFGVMQEYPMMKCIGIDMDDDSLKKAEEGYAYFESISEAGAEFIKGSAYSIPFQDNTFDLIVCSEVLEHLHEYNDAVVEINRVLKPSGKFFASVPASWPEKICWQLSKDYQNQPGGHLRIFDQKKLINEIEDCGFRLLSSEKFDGFVAPESSGPEGPSSPTSSSTPVISKPVISFFAICSSCVAIRDLYQRAEDQSSS